MPGVTATGAATKTVGNIKNPIGAEIAVLMLADRATGTSAKLKVSTRINQDR
jgi:hypothetical protein